MTVNKPFGTIISRKRCQELCSYWHGGQWSALYSFASSSIYVPDKHHQYIKELKESKPKTVLEQHELRSMIRWFEYKFWEHNEKLKKDESI